jgi:hypothetical protein
MPSSGREIVFMEFYPGETVESYLHRTGYLKRMGHQPYILTINGYRVPRSLWATCKPKPGMQIALYAYVQGGGGDDGEGGGKNVLGIVAMVIVVAIATYFFGPAGASGATGLWAAAGYSATVIVGSLIVNQMFPPPKPPKPKSDEDDSPTYSLSGGSNRMRRMEPFPKICGVHRVFPDFGSQPYSESQGDDAYGFYIFDFGYNDCELTDFKIGANSISNFTGVTLQISGTDGALTLFPGNVDSTVGTNLDHNDWVVRTSSPDTVALAVEIGGSVFRILRGSLQPIETQIQIQYRAVGAVDWTALLYASDTTPEIVNGSPVLGVARLPDPQANPLHYVFDPITPDIGEINIVSFSRRPIRRKYFWHVAKGTYEVRVRHLSSLNEPPNEGITREIGWSQLRSYQPDTTDYTGRLRVALKIKASSQLEGVIDQFSAIARARTLVWTGSDWVLAHTSNPAWWFLDAARGTLVNDKKVYGANMEDARIDIEGLKLFGAWCDTNGLKFDGVFDSQISVYELLSAIAIMGRGTPTWATGKLGVVWDAPSLPITGVFGMHNILPGTFEVEYNTQDLAEVIEGEFINPELDWQTDIVRVNIPGASDLTRVRRLQLFGRINKTVAGQDVNLYAAQQVYRNRRYKWQSDWEAMPVSRGDVIQLSHDLSTLDYSGRFIEGGDSDTLKLPRKVPLYSGGSFIVIVRPDGEFSTFTVNAGAGETDTLQLVSPLEGGTASYNPYGFLSTHPPYDFRWLYGATATPGKKLKVDGFRPMNTRVVEISCIDEVEAFYNAKNGTFEHIPVGPMFGGEPALESVSITEEGVRSGIGYVVRAIINWEVTGDYGFADVKISRGVPPVSDADITVATDIRGRSYEILVEDNTQLNVEVTAYSSVGRHGKSAKVSASKLIAFAASKIPFDVEWFQIDGTIFRWAANEEVDIKGYVIRFHYGTNLSWGDANPFHLGYLTGNAYAPPSVPPGIVTFMIKAFDAAGLESENPAFIIKDLGDPHIANVLEVIDFEADSFPGTVTNGTEIGSNLEANSSTSFYNVDENVSMYAQNDGDPFYKQDLFQQMIYETDEFGIITALAGSVASVEFTIQGVGLVIEFRNTGPNPIYGADAESFYGADADPFYDPPPDYSTYTGPFVIEHGAYQLRVTIGEGMTQAIIDHLTLTIDAPDIEDRLDNVSIGAAGTRLPITPDLFTSIKNVQLTLQSDGGSAITAEIIDKDTDLGPLVKCFNSVHTAVTGLVDAVVKGY